MKKNKPRIESVSAAKLEWNEHGPISTHYEDIYFSKDDGVAETEYVFLKQNNLPEAWINKSHFSILETGFGTGLNFFCTLEEWFKTTDSTAWLTYISVEKFPLKKEDFQKQLNVWPQFSDYVKQVLENYPPMVTGFHSCLLFDGRIKLILLFGDATEQLSKLTASVDVCYLDGFAPSKNKSMWSDALFLQLSRLVKVGGTISTFTAVGDVRRGLQQVGFDMKKADAYGKKRHMLVGRLVEPADEELYKPWFQLPVFETNKRTVIIIGAGIAGLTSAVSLMKAGWDVTVVEKSSSVASGASGNPAGVVMPRVDKQQSAEACFYWQAFFYAVRTLRQYKVDGVESGWKETGVLQLVDDVSDYSSHWPSGFFKELDQSAIETMSGVSINNDAVFLENAGYIQPAEFCKNICDKYRDKINFVFDSEVTELIKHQDGWQVETVKNIFQASSVIICNAQLSNQFDQTNNLNLQAVRGQVSELSVIDDKIKTVICDQGYAIPVDNQELLIGATFARNDTDRSVRSEDHHTNLEQINESLNLSFSIEDINSGRASVRAMTKDRLPMLGGVPDVEFYQHQYSDLARGKKASSYQSAQYHNGLYINSGHGSRGLTSSFLCAEIITALISGEPIPLEADLFVKLHPARFMIKSLLSGKNSSN